MEILVGAERIPVPRIANFAALERCGAAIDAMAESRLHRQQVSAACAFFAQLLLPTRPEITLPWIKENLRINRADGSDQCHALIMAMDSVLRESGLVKSGEEKPPAPAGDAPAA
jgi:hypothetical protein